MDATRVEIVYRSLEIDKDLDEKIIEFFNTLDYTCIYKLHDPMTTVRSLIVEKQSKEIEDGSKRDKEAQLTT